MDKFIYLPLYCGLCNRLFPFLSCLRLARLTGRKMMCYWTPNPGRSCLMYYGESCHFLDLFKPIEGVEFVELDVLYNSTYNCVFYNFDYMNNPKFIVDINTDKDIFIDRCLCAVTTQEEGELDWNKLSKGDEKLDTFLASYKTFLSELKPVDELQERIEKIKATFTDKMIGVHIRRTDGGFATQDWTKTDITLMSRVLHWIDKGYTIFLASDDPKYEDMFGDKNVIVNREPGRYNNDKTNNRNAVIDLYLLSFCGDIIGTEGSTFSTFAYLLSKNSKFWSINSDPKTVSRIHIQ